MSVNYYRDNSEKEGNVFKVYWRDPTMKLHQCNAATETHNGAIEEVKAMLVIDYEEFLMPILVLIAGGKQ